MGQILNRTLVVLIGIIGLLGCGKPTTGILKIADNETIQVIDSSGNKTVLKSGPSSIKVEGDRLLGSTRTLTLNNHGKKSKIKIPDSGFLSAADFSVSSKEIDQGFDLQATKNRILIGAAREEKGITSCTYAGYCMDCSTTANGEMDCGLQFNDSCEGKQAAVLLKQNYRDVTSIVFVRQSKPIAEFTSDMLIEESSKVIKRIGSCK